MNRPSVKRRGTRRFRAVAIGAVLATLLGHFTGSAHAQAGPNQLAIDRYVGSFSSSVPGHPTFGSPGSLAFLASQPDPTAYQAALDRLSPEAYDAHAEVLLDLADQFTRQILDRPYSCSAFAGGSTPDLRTRRACAKRHQEPWLRGYGAFLRRDGGADQISFESNGGGVAVGFDRRFFDDRLLLSSSLGAGRAVLQVDGIGKGRLTSVDLALYAGTRLGPVRLDGLVGYGHGWHEGYRNVRWLGVAYGTRGRFQSDRLAGRLRVAGAFDWHGWQFEPRTSIDYTGLQQQAFDETPASPVGLEINRRWDAIVTWRAEFEIGASYNKGDYWGDLFEWADGVWRPRLRIGWRQQLLGRDREISARVILAPPAIGRFRVKGRSADRGVELGTGLDFTPRNANRLTLGLLYDAFYWSGMSSHHVSANLRFGF